MVPDEEREPSTAGVGHPVEVSEFPTDTGEREQPPTCNVTVSTVQCTTWLWSVRVCPYVEVKPFLHQTYSARQSWLERAEVLLGHKGLGGLVCATRIRRGAPSDPASLRSTR